MSVAGPQAARLTGRALYGLYGERFCHRHPLPWRALHEPERRLWASLAGDLLEHLQQLDREDNPHGGKREQGSATESCSAPDVAPETRASWRKLAEAEQDRRLDDALGSGRR
jgi:hypothetical protein